jgi:hypothetical protein
MLPGEGCHNVMSTGIFTSAELVQGGKVVYARNPGE